MPAPRKPNLPRTQRTQTQRNAPSPRQAYTPQSNTGPEIVDPRWLLKALGIVFAVALLFAWGTLCLLWYQGQWQLVLHPSRKTSVTPASLGLNFTPLHFAVDATGQPQLTGWSVPVDVPGQPTALILHGADGSDSDALQQVLTLHQANLNVFLFDYRGYGASAGQHPSEPSMQQDAEDALRFLVSTQHISPQNIILYGSGIGASLAVQLVTQHRDIPAIILEAPDGDLADRAIHDPRSRLVPARLLFHEAFPLAEPLRNLTTPKLLITYGTSAPPALANSADPKITIELPSLNDPALIPTIHRFLDQYAEQTNH